MKVKWNCLVRAARPRRGRRILYLLVAAILVGAVAASLWQQPREPQHAGRSASAWIHEATEGPSEQRERALEALQAMEPEIYPWLIELLRPPRDFMPPQARSFLVKLRVLPSDGPRREQDRQLAKMGLQALRPSAETLVPWIEPLLRKRESFWSAADVLRQVCDGMAGVFVRALQSRSSGVRADAAEYLAALQSQHCLTPREKEEAVSALLPRLRDRDANVRSAAARAVGTMAVRGEQAVPALTDALTDAPLAAQSALLTALRSYVPLPTHTRQAVEKLLAHRSAEVRREAGQLLETNAAALIRSGR